ncbi:hypothetical protein A2Y85_05610 [candidate division WOR-3 bacterium RBG_13_43_14]|uniref:DNA mismatch repair proteins mutS family domain-containing protein n=1 Tax=candidate division WOR-3 bacterium RBG_13_43_14 TaxID=1802590 RepID=A0A1F4UF85_UNCW3|nr:MAG: hypothetical protein A2Y85_05610 [candidate division WOR-3 bacterium RBG_13_43_14]
MSRFGEPLTLSLPSEPGELEKELINVIFLNTGQLHKLYNWFVMITGLKRKYRNPPMNRYFNGIADYTNIISELDKCVDQNGEVRDNASVELARIRTRKRKLKNNIHQKLLKLLSERSNIFSDATIVERNNRYVLPLKRNFKKDFNGIVHAYSNSGETVFVEPVEITDDAALLVELEEQETQEIERILKQLTALIRTQINDIESDIETVVGLDLRFAKVKFANELNATRPVFGDGLTIIDGYHPILKRISQNVVPLNLKLVPEKTVLLISGPNAGGKTVVLKTIGLLVQMAKCGFFITAGEGSIMPFFEEVYADIGDEQSIEFDLSTFAGHLKWIKESLNANRNSLILLDELMSQTSAEEGSALASALLEEFVRKGGTVIATTHNETLKIFASQHRNMINGGMEYADRPTYRLMLGVPQSSNAIKLARTLGINGPIIDSAIKHLSSDKLSVNTLLEDLSRERTAAEKERKELDLMIKEYKIKLDELNTRRKKEVDDLRLKYKQEMVSAKRSVERLIKDLRSKKADGEIVKKAREFFDQALPPEEKNKPYYPRIGELVHINGISKPGLVMEEHDGKYKISLENIFYWVEPESLIQLRKEK